MTAVQKRWQRVQQMLWLIGGLLCLLLSVIFWAIADSGEQVTIHQPESETEVAIQPEKVAATSYLGGMLEEVRPLQLTTRVVASGDHAPEFRGSKFLEQHKNKYTIELFSVAEEDVITTFFKKQDNRKDLYYLRLIKEDQPERYVAIYGTYSSAEAAQEALNTLNIGVPKVVTPQVVALKDYVAQVNDMGSEEKGLAKKLYEINLRPAPLPKLEEYAPRPKPVVRPQPRPAPSTPAPTSNNRLTQEDVQKHFN